MSRIIKIILGLVLLSMVQVGFAQEQQQTNYLPNIAPPSPTAYELGKYGEIPVGMFTGTPQVDVPLYNHVSKNIEVPISLSYRSNGIKVDQLSPNTGLGWNLNAGGVITKVVRDEEDGNGLKFSYPKSEPRGTSGLRSSLVRKYFFTAAANEVDSEPDLYSFNFMGYTGSFVFDDDGKIIMAPINDLRIKQSDRGFEIIDSKGYLYIFKDTELTINRSSGRGHVPPSNPIKTAWFLSKIIDPRNGHQVNFRYSDNNYSYILSKTDQLKVPSPPFSTKNCSEYSFSGGQGAYTVLPEITNTMTVIGKQLESISSSDGNEVTFDYDTPHPDVLGYKMVTAINVKNKNDKVIQSFSLKYLKTSNKRVFLETISFLNPIKKYSFEYIDPEGLASRLSKAQDHWGYFNGKVNNRYWFPNPKSFKSVYTSFKGINVGANKSIHSPSAEKGLLRKVTYPTNGYTEFQYEQNSHWDKIIHPSKSRHLTLNVHTNESFENAKMKHTVYLNNIPENQKARFYINVTFNSNSCSENLLKATVFVKLTDKTTGESVRLFKETLNGGVNVIGNLFRQSNENQIFYAKLKKDCSYELELEATQFCTRAEMGITYTDKPPTIIYANIPTGGKRIKNILLKANSNALTKLTTYYYGKKESPQKSSGEKGKTPYYYTRSTLRKACKGTGGGRMEICQYIDIHHLLLSSSSLRKLFYSNLFTTHYKYVTVSKGGANFELGGEESEFILHNDHTGNQLFGGQIQYAPLVNGGWRNGLLKRKVVFKKNNLNSFTNLSETHHSYKLDNRLGAKTYAYSIRKNFDLICSTNTTIENLDILEYTTNSYWFYKYNTIQKTFDTEGNNPIKTITNYFYDNPIHKQLTKTTITTSNGKTIIKKLYYPDDVNSATSLPGGSLSNAEFQAIKKLQAPTKSNPYGQNRIGEVVQEVTEVADVEGSATVFKRNNDANWGNNIILPKSVQTLKGSTTSTGFEERAVFHRYDSHANPLEVSQKDGMHTVYLYGYSKQNVIAQIQNATFSGVATALGVSENALEKFNENHLAQINGLRSQKPEWMITTYTHIPLVGVKAATDPKGLTTTYEYDDFNRLKHIKDHNGDILEAYDYHYKNE